MRIFLGSYVLISYGISGTVPQLRQVTFSGV